MSDGGGDPEDDAALRDVLARLRHAGLRQQMLNGEFVRIQDEVARIQHEVTTLRHTVQSNPTSPARPRRGSTLRTVRAAVGAPLRRLAAAIRRSKP
jgi:hypothetical protein